MRARYSSAPRSPQTDVADGHTKGLRDGETPQGSQLETRAGGFARNRCARAAPPRAGADRPAVGAVPALAAPPAAPAVGGSGPPVQPRGRPAHSAGQQPEPEPEPEPKPGAGQQPG